jgi:putative FmdB family regulatory protein
MPTYKVKCNYCGKIFEKFCYPIDDIKCDCGGSVKKLITGGSGIIFVGSGFYVNDYKQKDR